MICDGCGTERYSFTELQWNHRWKREDTLFRIRERKMMVCPECLPKYPDIDPPAPSFWRSVATKAGGSPAVARR